MIPARPIAGITGLAFEVEPKADGYVDNSPLRSELPTYPQLLLRLRLPTLAGAPISKKGGGRPGNIIF